MFYTNHIEGPFKSVITIIFTTLLFVGGVGVNNALATGADANGFVFGSLKGKNTCYGEGIEKTKINNGMSAFVDISGHHIKMDIVIVPPNLAEPIDVNVLGTGFLVNKEKGIFMASNVDDHIEFGDSLLVLKGNFKLKTESTIQRVWGMWQLLDSDGVCIAMGKFKAKRSSDGL